MPEVTVLHSHAELLSASGDDAFIRWDVPDPLAGPACALGDAVAGIRFTHRRGRQLFCLGPAEDVAELVARVLRDRYAHDLRGVSVPQPTYPLVSSRVHLGTGNDWVWMATGTPPQRVSREDEILALTDADRPEVEDLLARANPGTDALPWADGRTWLGIRDSAGRLVACGARGLLPSGAAELVGVTVVERARNRGLGRALSARLTRDALGAAPMSTLGAYSVNEAALRTYAGLGYADAHPWSSRRVPRPAES